MYYRDENGSGRLRYLAKIPERSAVASRTQINLAKYMYVFWSSVAPAFFFAIESFE
ncbi:hypothetical protein BDV24DRAFT_135841 [Aspergillus arachidicola]|uniref:Uncharacterized protein n=1 Tax=Aspergillus arachidicola TaxID=656916 RepID=A0A5N6Y1R4_9EURO|nr:hypothetical protein BDV24DRAFT_135841 [Aspergillus arachidicola]